MQFITSVIIICIYKIVIFSGRYVIGNHLLCWYFVSNLESDGVQCQYDGMDPIQSFTAIKSLLMCG